MVKKGSPKDIHEKSWKLQTDNQIREEYKEYLNQKGLNGSPHNAHLFAIEKIKQSGGFEYHGYNERQIIILLEGKLPDFN